MYCRDCGNELTKNSEFCHKCGSKVTVAEAEKQSEAGEKLETKNKPTVEEEKPNTLVNVKHIKTYKLTVIVLIGAVFLLIGVFLFNIRKNNLVATNPVTSTKIDYKNLNVEEANKKFFELQANACTNARFASYTMPSEFSRSISLIYQRFNESEVQKLKDKSKIFKVIKNCLNIQYVDPKELGSALGIFHFDNKVSNVSNLKISVSSNYKSQDDLITAFLIVHEMTHAADFYLLNVIEEGVQKCDTLFSVEACSYIRKSVKDGSIPFNCLDEEVSAFANEALFYLTLNQGEEESLVTRLDKLGNKSEELIAIKEIINLTLNNDPVSAINKYVKGNPYYQEQCAGK